MEEKKTVNRLLVALGAFLLLVVTYLGNIYYSFSTPERATNTLKASNTYFYVSEAVKERVRDSYPTQIEDSFLKREVADRLVDFIITPTVFEKRSEGFISLFQRILERPIVEKNEEIILETAKYKENILASIDTLGLPDQVKTILVDVTNSAPNQIQLVNKEERPNSLLATAIQISQTMSNIRTVLTISVLVLAIVIFAIVARNWERWYPMLSQLSFVLIFGGLAVIVVYFLIQAITGSAGSENREQAASHLITTLNQMASPWGLTFLLSGLGLYAADKYLVLPRFGRENNKETKGRASKKK